MSCLRALSAALVAVLATIAATAAPAHAASGPVAVWAMNERPGARVMADSSGNRLHGAIGREVRTGVAVSGARAYRFERLKPNTPPARPEHLIRVPDHSNLDPGTRDYAVTVRIRTTHSFGNIIQKGQATVAGGYFKFQIPSGYVQCLFRGSSGTIEITANRAINDGRWHTVRCERTRAGVTLIIDGRIAARRAGWTGTIANTWPLSIGGKLSCDQIKVTCDYYPGDIDSVRIEAR
jgi:hypothetical protein